MVEAMVKTTQTELMPSGHLPGFVTCARKAPSSEVPAAPPPAHSSVEIPNIFETRGLHLHFVGGPGKLYSLS